MRGNGWYTQPMITHCLKHNLIQESDIKYVIYSGLTVPKYYFNPFIDEMYTNMGEFGKLSVNVIVGCLKARARQNWKTLCITTNANTATYHYLNAKGCFIHSRKIGDVKYHQVYEEFITNKEESEAPIYNMILELEAIEMHTMAMLIESQGGLVLDISTDEIACVFPNDEMPFELNEDGSNVNGYYYDIDKQFPKYKIVEKDEEHQRLKVEKLPSYVRKDKYDHKEAGWKIQKDVADNDFKPLVDNILDSHESCHVDGMAGTSKSTLVRLLREEMKKRH